jgi:hypothetical protein
MYVHILNFIMKRLLRAMVTNFTNSSGTSSISSSAPRSPMATIAYDIFKINYELKTIHAKMNLLTPFQLKHIRITWV